MDDSEGDYACRGVLQGHNSSVHCCDFHPTLEPGLLASAGADGELRLWSVQKQSLKSFMTLKGDVTQLRFEPEKGQFLAAAQYSSTAHSHSLTVIDPVKETVLATFAAHTSNVCSLLWSHGPDGLLISVAQDCAKMWSLRDGKCVRQLEDKGSTFNSAALHPRFSDVLVMGLYQGLQLWDFRQNKTNILEGVHGGLVSALASSNQRGLLASASHDTYIKLWR
eukprot:TRINITY_DN6051_c0_g1::TRINITY_DN6051_c0_g1_i1::g.25715::m.25715 TRINITY_DN6051_c0_g1::TRINITY_DN6051_c0_g1_i1::g.25715  ORF type:complete len:229 (-),score=28.86,sp/O48847/LUH_ARATH/38.46/2e-39,sp/O48847/LUH_ARATH/27.67/8e-06,WD40/PF00400.27/1.2e-10,WD40/PF00400.27/1.8e+02,WD40/PF00400.27/4.1e+03,WD40/PF00400.27/0.0016,WD40/PF00400.27/9.7e+02,WD40/PF00400.27/0.0017,Nucleoporin_N/PF08801.6/0.21,Nucleoporin_N/PF08801.6/1.9e+02 TRINITY_DN6051_c0_g1_i1:1059-1724(-)